MIYKKLTPRRIEIWNHYIRGKTYDEIAQTYGLSKQRISQIIIRMKQTVKYYPNHPELLSAPS